MRIEVLQVNIADRNIDFIMAGENDAVRDRIKAQLLGQRSNASARSAIEKREKAAVAKSRWINAAKAALAAINMSITRKARKKVARKNNHNQVNNNGRKENQNHCGKQKSQT